MEFKFTKCGLDGLNLFMDKELPNDHIIAKCKVCGHGVKLNPADNNKSL
jgi:hypothetical protein